MAAAYTGQDQLPHRLWCFVRIEKALCLPQPPARAEYARLTLRREPLVAVVGSNHPLARLDAVTLEDLRDQTFCFFPRHIAPTSYDAVLGALHHTARGSTSGRATPQARHAACARATVSLWFPLPWTAPTGRHHKPPPPGQPATVDLELIWKPDSLSPSTDTLITAAHRLA